MKLKVIELESNQGTNSPYTIQNKEWQKNILHLQLLSNELELNSNLKYDNNFKIIAHE